MMLNAVRLAQLWGALRILVPAAISAAAAAGWLGATDAGALSSALTTAVPAFATLVAVVWSIVAHSKSATIAAAASIPDVKAVVTAPAIADSSTFAANPKVITSAQALSLAEGARQQQAS